jgi:hypothetical protein
MASPPAKGPAQDDNERRRAAAAVAVRLDRRGIWLSGHETSEELADLLEAVEQFERIVERSGGDLMVDEPVVPDGRPIAPDDSSFVLPRREHGESAGRYIDRVGEAARRAAQHHPRDR